jgi:hypothetical protein
MRESLREVAVVSAAARGDFLSVETQRACAPKQSFAYIVVDDLRN